MAVGTRPRLFSVDEYERMGEAGILSHNDRVELIEGRVLEMDSHCGREPGAPHMFTVHDFEHMAEVGILHEDDRVELVEGDILEMAPIGSRHSACVQNLNRLLSRRVDTDQVSVRVQDAIRLDPETQPQPDIVLARFREDLYKYRQPGADEIFLLIEVADSSLTYDRWVKLPMYARARVPEVWLIDLTSDSVHIFREPASDHYEEHHVAERAESLYPRLLPEFLLKVDEILV
jgi:Uma2 family endonuclease